MKTKTLAIALAAAVLATQFATPSASAGERRNPNPFDSVRVFSRQVPTADLDPTTVRGAKALYRRIVTAAEQVCLVPVENNRVLPKARELNRASECFDNAVAAAVADVRAIASVDIEQLAGVKRAAALRMSAIR